MQDSSCTFRWTASVDFWYHQPWVEGHVPGNGECYQASLNQAQRLCWNYRRPSTPSTKILGESLKAESGRFSLEDCVLIWLDFSCHFLALWPRTFCKPLGLSFLMPGSGITTPNLQGCYGYINKPSSLGAEIGRVASDKLFCLSEPQRGFPPPIK